MSKDQYLEMMEQMGEDPDWDKCPPDWEDFPELVTTGVNIFYSMGDRVFPDIGYIGKDYTNFELLLKIYKIKKHQINFINELVLWLDSRAVEISQKKLKAEYDRMKRRK